MPRYSMYQKVRTPILNLIPIGGWFETDGAGAPPTRSSALFTVAAPSTGVYVIQLRQGFKRFHAVTTDIDVAGGGDEHVKLLGYSATAGTITVETRATADGAAANIDGPFVHFIVFAEYT